MGFWALLTVLLMGDPSEIFFFIFILQKDGYLYFNAPSAPRPTLQYAVWHLDLSLFYLLG